MKRLALTAACLIAGCTVTPQQAQPAQAPEEIIPAVNLAAADARNEQFRRDASKFLRAKRLDADTADLVQRIANIAQEGIDRARGHYFDGNYAQAADALRKVDALHTQAHQLIAHNLTKGAPK